jgi:hypothetical protein
MREGRTHGEVREGVKMRYVLEGECCRFIRGAFDRLWKENRSRERKTGCVILRRACSYEIGIYRRQGGRRVVKKQQGLRRYKVRGKAGLS